MLKSTTKSLDLKYVFLRLRIVLFRQVLRNLELDKILDWLGDGEVVGLVHIFLLEPSLHHLVGRHSGRVSEPDNLR